MIRSKLVARLADLNPHLYQKDAEPVVDAILGRIEEALAAGDTVELRGFGTFSTMRREARERRNPRTGDKVTVPAKIDVRFKPSKTMRTRLNPRSASGAMARE
ncbi:HU family DNA-binding protein [uncultured Methylobacterium sp.]|uniref:HU family DNA-binding protein n=1 Tax=uncultured Methylobacterium sp. TaxID=157278 RepID=UPI0025960D8A|nr:HU family DNA-binding protein [uncultured Methylobacterium sp.]